MVSEKQIKEVKDKLKGLYSELEIMKEKHVKPTEKQFDSYAEKLKLYEGLPYNDKKKHPELNKFYDDALLKLRDIHRPVEDS